MRGGGGGGGTGGGTSGALGASGSAGSFGRWFVSRKSNAWLILLARSRWRMETHETTYEP